MNVFQIVKFITEAQTTLAKLTVDANKYLELARTQAKQIEDLIKVVTQLAATVQQLQKERDALVKLLKPIVK